eukprot:2380170-Prymnesium_polylepis.1
MNVRPFAPTNAPVRVANGKFNHRYQCKTPRSGVTVLLTRTKTIVIMPIRARLSPTRTTAVSTVTSCAHATFDTTSTPEDACKHDHTAHAK